MTVMHHKTPWSAGRQRRIDWIILVAATAALAGLGNLARADDVFPHWEFLGPPSAPLEALAVAPSDPDILYGSYRRGLMGSEDGGRQWSAVSRRESNQDPVLAVDPHNPLVLLWGKDLIRSTDGGRTWSGPPCCVVEQVAFSPADSRWVYGTSDSRLNVSEDNGVNWRTLVLEGAGPVTSLAPSPSDPRTAWIGTRLGLCVTTDGGHSAQAVPDFRHAVEALAVSPADPCCLYAAATVPNSLLTHLLLVSHDGGNTWDQRPVTFDDGLFSTAWSGLLVTGTPPVLWAAVSGADWDLRDTGGIWCSMDEGQTWEKRSEGLPEVAVQSVLRAGDGALWCRPKQIGPYALCPGARAWEGRHTGLFSQEVRCFAVDPQDPASLYVPLSAMDGLYRSRDGGGSWELIQTDAPISECLLVHPRRSGWLLGGGWVGVARSTDDGSTWSEPVELPSVVHVLSCSALAPERVLACGTPVEGICLFRSGDFGLSWSGCPLPAGIDLLEGLDVAVAPSDPQRVYAGISGHTFDSSQLLRSDDGGRSWRIMQTNLRKFQQIVVDPQDEDTVYWHGGGPIRKSTDGGISYEILPTHMRNVEHGDRFSVGQILFSSHDRQVLYADGVARSSDGGSNWDDRKGDLESLPAMHLLNRINSFALIGGPHPYIFAAGSGLFRCQDNFPPCILAAGSSQREEGEAALSFTAAVWDRDGVADLVTAWVRFPDYGIELPLFDDGLHADGARGDGLFGFSVSGITGFEIEHLPYTISAVDAMGQESRSWPYLHVMQRKLKEDDQ